MGKRCQIGNCPRPYKAKGFCGTHYVDARRNGLIGPPSVCSLAGCVRPGYLKQYCSLHHQRYLKYGPSLEPLKAKSCSVDGCNRRPKARGMCSVHYERAWSSGRFEIDPRRAKNRKCSVNGCNRKHDLNGYCLLHHRQMKNHGRILSIYPLRDMSRRPFPITNGTRCCLGCNEVRPIEKFALACKSPSGRRSKCKRCERLHEKRPEKRQRKQALETQREQQDPTLKLRRVMRTRIREALRKNAMAKDTTTLYYLGCDIGTARLHLEAQFSPGMSWANYGFNGWHIDHKIPIASFDFTGPEEIKKAFHYSNLQPLWIEDHKRKTAQDIAYIKAKRKERESKKAAG